MGRGILSQYSKDELADIVSHCDTYTEVVRLLGYATVSGRNIDTLKRRLERDKISTSHFYNGGRTPTKRHEDNIFVENSTASHATLRRWYLRGEYTEYRCAICGMEPFWNGKPLVLTLDHINGKHNDDRLENLRWVCPNCDRQLPTFGMRGRHMQNTKKLISFDCNQNKIVTIKPQAQSFALCVDCGCKISPSATRCVNCANKKSRLVERPSKDDLECMLRNNPNFAAIGRRFGVGGNSIRRWCKQYGMSTYIADYKPPKQHKIVSSEKSKAVAMIDIKTNEVIQKFNSIQDAGRWLGNVHKAAHVWKVCTGKRKTAYGYKWRYI